MRQPSVGHKVKLAFLVTCLMLVSMWTYYGTTENLFVWDSIGYLVKYKDHISGLTVENLWWMTTSLEFYNWHPLTWLSWAVDYQLYGGLNTWGFHFSNNIFHSINGVLVFMLVLSVFGLIFPLSEKFAMRTDGNSLTAAFLASLLFIVHPQHVESVAWVAERKDLLCQLFLLLSLLAYVKYVTCIPENKTKWYFVTFGLFFLAVLSKPMAVTFPAVLMLVDIYPLRRTSLAKPILSSVQQQSIISLSVEKIPFLLMSLILALMTLKAQEIAISLMADVPFLTRLINAVHSTVFYLEKFLMPLWLSPHYPYFQVVESGDAVIALLVFLIFSTITLTSLLRWRARKRALLVAWLFYLVTLLPVLGLIQVGSQGAADRYAYFPTLPFYFLIAGGIYLILQKATKIKKTLLLLVVTIVVLFYLNLTLKQVRVWQSEESLWSHITKLDPGNMLAHQNLGIHYKNIADFENAALEFETVGEGSSVLDSTIAWRATTYMHLGRYKESIEFLMKLGLAAETKPDLDVDPYCIQYNIGWNFAHLEMYPEAIDLFSRIGSESGLRSDAGLWLIALNDVNQRDKMTVLGQQMPGICENLIPSRLWFYQLD